MSSTYNYRELEAEAKKRYLEKMSQIGIKECPYELPADVWVNQPTSWPQLEYPEVYEYLINTPGVFTREAMKNRKSLESHNQFLSGWVKTVFYYEVPSSSIVVMKALVMPSQRLNEAPHTPWISINKSHNSVLNAHCTCMAGLGESCTHIGAILFKIEAAVRTGYTRRACTEEACQWNDDFKDKVTFARISDIKFYTKKAVDNFKGTNVSNFSDTTPPSESDINNLLHNLSKQTKPPVLLHCYSDFFEPFIPKYHPPERVKLPSSLREWYSAGIDNVTDEMINEHLDRLKLTNSTIEYIEEATHRQADSPEWHAIRTGRITASKAHSILHTNLENPAPSIIKNICGESKVHHSTIPSLNWGKLNEKKAVDAFESKLSDEHDDVEIHYPGFRLHKELQYIGASPDGLYCCDEMDFTMIEVKCPYTKRDTNSAKEAAADKNFFLDENLVLKGTHQYYTQVQMQLFVYNLQKCMFIVWTPNWDHHQIILRNDYFIDSSIPVLTLFFKNHIIPELITRRLEYSNKQLKPNQEETDKSTIYCYCRSTYNDDEKWIGCDAERCEYKWFHYKCVNVKRPRKGTWYCPSCRKTKQVKRKNLTNTD